MLGSTFDQMTGILGAPGRALVRVTVYRSPVPDTAPPEVQAVAEPFTDPDRVTRDWRLRLPGGEDVDTGTAVETLTHWRDTFVTERYLGERGIVRLATDWLDERADASVLHVLHLPFAHLDVEQTLHLLDVVDRLRGAAESMDGPAFGVHLNGSATPGRCLLAPGQSRTLMEVHSTCLTIEGSGLYLRTDAHGPSDHTTRVDGWQRTDGHVVVNSPDGPLEVSDPDAVAVLDYLGGHARSAEVRALSPRSALAPLLVWIHDTASVAAFCHTGMFVRAA